MMGKPTGCALVMAAALLGCSGESSAAKGSLDAGARAPGAGDAGAMAAASDAGHSPADAGANATNNGGAGGASASERDASAADAASGGAGGANSDGSTPPSGDEYGPWAGGASYYKQFQHGPPSDPSFFPITVWLQSPDRAQDYAAIGINTFVGLWQGPTEDQLSMLSAADMPVACDQNDVGLAHVNDATIVAWTQQDEPDNAQDDGNGGYGPCVSASEVKNRYDAIKANDATRPVFLNLGQGVAHDYIGWGSECAATHPDDYPDYVAAADIVSFDIYPMNETSADVAGKPWVVAQGVDNLVRWAAGKKPVWNWIECTGIDDPGGKPTPEQVKAEVWMSIVHGSMGIGYFVHQFNPSFDEHALLDDASMKSAVAAINAQIHDLAPVLNEKPVTNGGTVTSSDPDVPVDMLLKRHAGASYLIAVAMRGSATHATFSDLTNLPAGARVDVLGEARTIPLSGTSFEDDFEPWAVHLYEIH